jgi:hypothetical protein
MGPKRGVARGTTVWGSPGFDSPESLKDLMSHHDRLRNWSLEHGIALNDDPGSLTALDQHLDSWNSDSSHHGKVDLANEVGIHLGNVIVKNIEGSNWKVWPNGHPVVRLPSGQELDVTAIANQRLNHSGANLETIYAMLQP